MASLIAGSSSPWIYESMPFMVVILVHRMRSSRTRFREAVDASQVGANTLGAGVWWQVTVVNWTMRLEPLYRMVFEYPQGWSVAVGGGGYESQHLFLAEGHCEGRISGTLRGA